MRKLLYLTEIQELARCRACCRELLSASACLRKCATHALKEEEEEEEEEEQEQRRRRTSSPPLFSVCQ